MSWRRLVHVQDGKRIVDWPRLIVVLLGAWAVLGVLEAIIPSPWFWIGLAIGAPALMALDVYLRRRH